MNRYLIRFLYIFAFVTISAVGLLHENSRTAAAEELESRRPCQLIDDWIKAGGTAENFSGIGVGSLPHPFPLCFPVVAKISHTGHERFVDSCGETYWEVNLAYDMEHEGELWLTKDRSQAFVSIGQSSGQQRSLKIHQADGFFFAGHDHTGCKHFQRHDFSYARQNPLMGVKLQLFAPPDTYLQRLFFVAPSFEEKTRMLSHAAATLFSIKPHNEAQINLSLPVTELIGLSKGLAMTREITWGGADPDSGHHWTSKMNFELRGVGGPGILRVTPADGLTARGPDKDGKFNPTQKTYTLKNVGQSPINFSVIKSKNWNNVTPAEGSLLPGGENRVTVSLNEKAHKLKKSEKDTVRFDNRTNQKGSTTRPVSVATTERWRVTFIGWETITTGGEPLIKGIRAYWTIAVDIEIEGGKYKSGRAKASFGNIHGTLKSYSLIPEGYACQTLKKRIDLTAFNVPGSVVGSIVRLYLPSNNFLRVHFMCQLDEKRTIDWLKKTKYGGQVPEDRIRGAYKERRGSGMESLPKGQFAVRLVDGHREPVSSPSVLNASPLEIVVKRLK